MRLLTCLMGAALAVAQPVKPAESDVLLRDFRFQSGETLPELRIHYRTLGTPARDSAGRITNAVLILHGTSGSGAQFTGAAQFHGELFGAGQALDTAKFFLIMPDGIGHGGSSKPSDGLKLRFPHYGYRDMVEAQRLLLAQLGVGRLRLILGTSMGCMQAWVWGTEYPDAAGALLPLACLPHPITGRNLLWRQLSVDLIRHDAQYRDGEYTQPPAALEAVRGIMTLITQNTLELQAKGATREAALAQYQRAVGGRNVGDANDLVYAIEASRDYDPRPKLDRVRARVTAINFADDPINPPELGIFEKELRRVPGARFLTLPAREDTHGHGNHTWAVYWKDELEKLLRP
jgi:homoserine O-acetyltransferase/O-succinyltransferase